MTLRNFQILVVVWQLLTLGITAVDYGTEFMLLPEGVVGFSSTESVLDPAANSIVDLVRDAAFWTYTLLGLLTAVGLIFFKSWARAALLVYVMFVLLITALSAPYPITSWTSMITYASNVVDGGLIALVYFSPIRRMFKLKADAKTGAQNGAS